MVNFVAISESLRKIILELAYLERKQKILQKRIDKTKKKIREKEKKLGGKQGVK